MKSRLIKTKVLFTIEGTDNKTLQRKINVDQKAIPRIEQHQLSTKLHNTRRSQHITTNTT